MASKRSKSPVKPRRAETTDPNKPRVINVTGIAPETFRFLAEGRGSQGVRSWLPYWIRNEHLRRAVVEAARQEPVTPYVKQLRALLASAGVLWD